MTLDIIFLNSSIFISWIYLSLFLSMYPWCQLWREKKIDHFSFSKHILFLYTIIQMCILLMDILIHLIFDLIFIVYFFIFQHFVPIHEDLAPVVSVGEGSAFYSYSPWPDPRSSLLYATERKLILLRLWFQIRCCV